MSRKSGRERTGGAWYGLWYCRPSFRFWRYLSSPVARFPTSRPERSTRIPSITSGWKKTMRYSPNGPPGHHAHPKTFTAVEYEGRCLKG